MPQALSKGNNAAFFNRAVTADTDGILFFHGGNCLISASDEGRVASSERDDDEREEEVEGRKNGRIGG